MSSLNSCNDTRFEEVKSLAGVLQPGDATRYEMVVTEYHDTIAVIVMNEEFKDVIEFFKEDLEVYTTQRGDKTNPWTVKAAAEMRDRFLGRYKDDQ